MYSVFTIHRFTTFHVNTRLAQWSHWRDTSFPKWLLGRITLLPSTVRLADFHAIQEISRVLWKQDNFFINFPNKSVGQYVILLLLFFCHVVYGHLFTFGSNKYGQLGVGDFRRHKGVCRVGGGLTGKVVDVVTCGDGFTVASING